MIQRILIILTFCSTALLSNAQLHRKELTTDSGRVVLHYFKGAKNVSTKEWIDKDDRWGRTWAYNQEGKEIYRRETRRIAGHASVHFTYHPNGAVAIAEYSSAPDAGIQWHEDKTVFDESGNQIGYEERGHDNYDLYPRPDMTIQPYLEKQEPVVSQCQPLFSNQAYVTNQTKFAMRVVVKVKDPSPVFKDGVYTLAPGDTVHVGTYTFGQEFKSPDKACDMTFERITLKKKKRNQKFKAIISTSELQSGETERKYFISAEKWKIGG